MNAVSAVDFAHLRVHSEYSIVDGLAKVSDLADAAADLGMKAVALTDRGNLYGLIKFYRACLGKGVKPILGLDLHHQPGEGEGRPRLTVLACSLAGYRNLLRLASCPHTGGGDREAVALAQLAAHSEGLILLSGAPDTEIGQAFAHGDGVAAERAAKQLLRHFPGRFYLEVLRTGRLGEEPCLRSAVELAGRLGLPVVATNEVCFLDAAQHEAHETRVCIHQGRVVNDPRRPRRHSAAQHLKSAAVMAELFADLPEALRNAAEIAKRCTVELDLGEPQLPDYPSRSGESLAAYLEQKAVEGLAARLAEIRALGAYPPDEAAYRERLEYELDVIKQTGYAGYFLIVMEFIAWAKGQGIPVGPGRGSGAGSLVAYALGVTNLDPVHFDLLFERFLNPERVSMPDFDVDFCVEGRDRVIQHVAELYGQEAVSQIATFGSMAAKAVVRDVARAQGKPYALGDKLAKLIPNRLGMTLRDAVSESAELRDFLQADEEAAEIMDMAYALEGVVRNVGRHAGGVVIAPSRLTDFVPVFVDEGGGGLISQYDKDDVEQAGLVKFDFLGLTTLTVIRWAVQAANRSIQAKGGAPIDIDQLPLGDRKTYSLLKKAETVGVFQLESRGMKDLIRRLQPDSIDDIIALVALYRPGPMQNGADRDYVERKHGRVRIAYPHPELEPVLRGTFGVVIYQEQVMQIARLLAGFSLGQADILRKAMGKKDPAEMAKVRDQFLAGAAAHGVQAELASGLFDQMATFAGYAFNKSHSATYALVAYQTAWLKAHHPAEFMAATLSADMENKDKVVTLIDEVRRLKLKLRPPSVNHSEFRFSVREGDILYGLGAVHGVGAAPVESIIEARADGPFTSLAAFCRRVDLKRVHKRVTEALILAGALDEFAATGVGVAEGMDGRVDEGVREGAGKGSRASAGAGSRGKRGREGVNETRARLLRDLDPALQAAEQVSRNQELGISDLFGGVGEEKQALPTAAPVKPLSDHERLEQEKNVLGLYLTGHPIHPYLPEFQRRCTRLAEVQASAAPMKVAGLVVDVRTLRGRSGKEMGFLVIDDDSARMEASLFPEVYERDKDKVRKGAILVLQGAVQPDDYNGAHKMRVDAVLTIAEWRQRASAGLRIDFNGNDPPDGLSQRLAEALKPHRVEQGGCPVSVGYRTAQVAGMVRLGWRVCADESLLQNLQSEFGADRVRMEFEGG